MIVAIGNNGPNGERALSLLSQVSILPVPLHPAMNASFGEASMPFTTRPYRRFPVYCPGTYQLGDFEGHGSVGICHKPVGDSLATCP